MSACRSQRRNVASVAPSYRELSVQDYVIIAVKAPSLPDIARRIGPLLGPETAVVTAMNGVPGWFFLNAKGVLARHHLKTIDPDGTIVDGDCVTTYKTYHGTHEGPFLGIAPTHRKIHFETVDVMRVRNGKITEHWGVANLLSLMQQIGGWTPPPSAEIAR
jgi:ketopantoate reductase